VVAKGLVRYPSARSAEWLGRRSDQLPDDLPRELIHRDDMVVLGE
jgi:glutamate 5-kinase